MRWIADPDKARIEKAVELLTDFDCALTRVAAKRELRQVLENMARLEQEQPHPEPRIAALSEAERRKIYPERYTG